MPYIPAQERDAGFRRAVEEYLEEQIDHAAESFTEEESDRLIRWIKARLSISGWKGWVVGFVLDRMMPDAAIEALRAGVDWLMGKVAARLA